LVTKVASVIYSHEEVGKGFEGTTQILVGDLLIPLIVSAIPLLGCKVGYEDEEGPTLEH